MYFVQGVDGNPPRQLDRKGIEGLLAERQQSPLHLVICPVGSSTWAPASTFGFIDPVAF
jgi:hypothetical protein